MSGLLALVVLGFAQAGLLIWGIRHLADERWQVFAVLPSRREEDGSWLGINITYYGLYNALAISAAVALAMVLAGSVGLPLGFLATCIVALLALTLPASRIVNRLVEGHAQGFTVGGACFIGVLAAPWIFWGLASLLLPGADAVSVTPWVFGAFGSAYALGEGIGRLACLSFGCCYGLPLADCPDWLRRLLWRWACVFNGPLKKACYVHGFHGQRLIPIQALTAVVSSLAALGGTALYMLGRPLAAALSALGGALVWRFVSEFLRADDRGRGRISAYQWLALAGAAYTVLVVWRWPSSADLRPDLARGLALLWTPEAVLLIEAVALLVFVRMGRSTVTTARIVMGLASVSSCSIRAAHAPHHTTSAK